MITLYEIDYHKFNDYAASLCQYPYSIWLDSSDTQHKNGHFSFVIAEPFITINSKNNHGCLFDMLKSNILFSNTFQNELKQERKKYNDLPPFIGGFSGFVSYDYCVQQRFNLPYVPCVINAIPQFYGGLYDCVLYANHHTKQAGIVALQIHPNKTPHERIDSLLNKVKDSPKNIKHIMPNIDIPNSNGDIYRNNVTKTIDYIKQGDIFQANIARSVVIQRPDDFNSFEFYKSLRNINASPFGCYIYDKDFQIMSASPERLLRIDNRKITVEPIKGTIKSNPDINCDIKQRETLLNCPKNRAENMIIVDLLRNDITPYAKTGTIQVKTLCELQTFKGLHHLVSTITADMRDNACVIDVIKMALPGGSITGAPKKRVCEIIYELENAQRGAYCGSAGYIGFDGNADMNILIRTVQADTQTLVFHSGCGITAQSDPESEWQETHTKADKILQSFKMCF
jgi:para-aminobenzoate synthetase component I